ncbi:hypothetical protein [Mangrovimonas cancribranchiae]|uniref:Uncharacterized protein n=1 Tax=Mangrovimonas cancribranchiae TaxID=3080055 RepID=A0AAU6NXN8_9FLAO
MKVSTNQGIKNSFTKYINANGDKRKSNIFSDWYCGITNNVNIRNAQHKKKHGEITYWMALKANSKNEANEIETYYNNKGTINSSNIGGAVKSSSFVYIFKMPKLKPLVWIYQNIFYILTKYSITEKPKFNISENVF